MRDREGTLRALQLAVREALSVHKRLGQPVVVWEEGQIVELAAVDIPVSDDVST